jgi:hypothetical protein
MAGLDPAIPIECRAFMAGTGTSSAMAKLVVTL